MDGTKSTLDFWKEKFWSVEKFPWHLHHPHDGLLTYGDKLFNGKKCRVLVPLCGKTVDLKWLYDQGHTVVGAEGCNRPIEEFFKESRIDFTINGNSYQSIDGRLTILHGNFFEMSADFNGSFEAIWDRAAMVAVDSQHRDIYAQTIMRLASEDARLIIVTTEYDQRKVEGPPWSITKAEVERLYGIWGTVEILTEEQQPPDTNEYINDNFIKNDISLKQSMYLLVKK